MSKLDIKFQRLTPFKRCVLQNFPFIEEDFDALTNYGLLCKIVAYLNRVIDSQNEVLQDVSEFEENVTENFEALRDKFVELKAYVDNYFNNLDVQEEINNKLDDMVEDGTLQEIISDYLNATAVWGFDNVASMKSSTNLIDGSYARTLGYYAKNDGGEAIYKIRTITNEDVVDEGSIIAIGTGTLIAELIKSPKGINVKQFGAKGDGLTDDYTAIQNAINSLDSGTVYFPVAKYIISHYLTPKANVNLKGGFSYKYYDTLDTGLCFSGTDGIYGNASIFIEDLIIQNTSGELVNSGIKGKGFKINRCLITGFASGINANYGTAIIENCNIFGNDTGITQIVDSRVINNTINANNSNGIYLSSGSNDNIIANNKIEWNGSRGVQLYQANDNVISNNVIDRNTVNGIEVKSSQNVTVTANMLRRNCTNTDTVAVGNAQLYIEGSTQISLSANTLRTGNSQDDGTGVVIPQYAVYVTTTSNLISVGNDFSGGGTQTPTVNTYNNGENVQFLDSGFQLQKFLKGSEYNSGNITSGTSRTLTLPATLAYDNGLPQLDKFNYFIRRTDKGDYEAGEIDLSNFVLWGDASSTSAKISKDSFLSGDITATVTCDRTNSVYSLTLSTTDADHGYEVKLIPIYI